MYKQQECYVQYTYNSICNVFVVLNCSPPSNARKTKTRRGKMVRVSSYLASTWNNMDMEKLLVYVY